MAARTPNRATKSTGARAPASRRASSKASAASSGRGDGPAKKRRSPTPTNRSYSGSKRRAPGGLLLWVVCGSLVLAAWWMYPVMRTHYLEQRNLASLQAEYASVRSRNDALRKQVERLKTPAGIEEAARESLGLVLKGESAYVVIDPGAGKPGTSTTSASLALPASVTPTSSDPLTTLLDGIFGLAP